jgi:hypothetical protein
MFCLLYIVYYTFNMSNLIHSEIYCQNEEENLKKKRKPKIPDLPNRIVVIKNSEKDEGNWMEKWDKTRSPGFLPHPFRLLALGGVGRGKTNCMKNIFLKHQAGSNKFQKLIIITCSEESTEWDDCDPDDLMTEIPDLEMFNGEVKTCVILDDFETIKISKEQLRKLSTLMRFISSHRNVSVMLGYQSYFDCPNICRKVANCFMIYKPNSRQEIDTIANRVGLTSDQMRYLFKHIITGSYDHLFVDITVNTPFKLRKNIYEVIEQNSDSD